MATIIFHLAIFALLFGFVHSVCKDLDAEACVAIRDKMPTMCSDPCLAVMCSDTCNNCPLQCYSCNDQLNPEDCKRIIQCNKSDQVCIAVQRLTSDFIPLFSSGCESRDVCMQVFGNINIRKRSLIDSPPHSRSVTLKGGCCDIDRCNVHDPENEPTEPPGYVRTTIRSDINPTYLPDEIKCTGDDMNATACAALMAADPNICSRNCVAQKICQSMCKTCVKCFKCDAATTLASCKTSEVCNVNQKCVYVEQLGVNFLPIYRMGCMDDSLCLKFFGSIRNTQPVGKRQVKLTGGCCSDNLCNNKTITP